MPYKDINKRKEHAKEYRMENKEKAVLYQKEYRKTHKEKAKKYSIEYVAINKDKLKVYKREYYLKNITNIKKKSQKYYQDNIIECRKRNNEYQKINRKEANKRNKKYKQHLYVKVKACLRIRITSALKGQNKSLSTMFLIGCEIDYLMYHLQKQFKPGMGWDNRGVYGWHIDHIKPCASFDLSKPEEQRKCFHYTNLQPLWADENFKKGSKI